MKDTEILVVIDYQNDFVDGSLGFPGAEKLDEGIVKKIMEYKNNPNGKILYTQDIHGEDYLNTREGKALPIPHCILNTPGAEVYGKTKNALKKVKAVSLSKATFGVNPFIMTLPKVMNPNENVTKIELVGLVTNMCVISNVCVFQAAWPNAQIIVDASLCDSFNKELHDKTFDILEGLQVNVINR